MKNTVSEGVFHHYAITVADLPRMIAWYDEVLGFREDRRFSLASERIDIVMLESERGMRLELLHRLDGSRRPEPTDMGRPGAKHICFESADVTATAEDMTRCGATVVQQPKDVPEAGVRNLWIADPEGNLIEFIEEMRPAEGSGVHGGKSA